MKLTALVAATFCILAPPAGAADPNATAEREARAWLTLCHEMDRGQQQRCLRNQQAFIFEYVSAKAGNLPNMGDLSAFFRQNRNPSDTEGLDRLGITQRIGDKRKMRKDFATILGPAPGPTNL